ncbi:MULTISPECIES: hypothetical protein [Pseudomonas]|jgi:hypothetical protein|uniref:BufA2 family periplasmic bufferin-type metallophore n=1 Tax=Pseudomonas TaxID=286 RepID=UPI0008541FDE|nr:MULTISPECIES: hypothetical protein [Pseudomonas]MAB98024.1 hypothetical protein [Pseudomonadaceae bacterium]MBQ54910.1 hypothetical protein [Pseudomonadaceae bacterium]NRH27555.1 hypothetical protein [Pseudomonas sp. MS19]OEO25877.1 hypothetical protein AX279_10655 [Pseudomonas sp. J237]SFT96800.1 hypothetical protein SAMN05216264_107112 [Pseudomonas marincola]|tara:strand:+ start:1092 stop:1352 length:261 start_codon:yes stop_codon:yes gene_type:complete
MSTKTNVAATGAAIAFAAATMFATMASTVVVAEESPVHCFGVNSCKGQNDCKTANNACKGQGICKGQGFKAMSLAECNAAKGTVGE